MRARVLLNQLLFQATFSSLYRSLPQDDQDQPDFWNAVASGGWIGTADSLLERLLMIEAGEGRLRTPSRPKGPRILDLDLLTIGDEVRDSDRLALPHPGLSLRRFALEPLVELFPEARDPRTGGLWAQGLGSMPAQGVDRTGLPW